MITADEAKEIMNKHKKTVHIDEDKDYTRLMKYLDKRIRVKYKEDASHSLFEIYYPKRILDKMEKYLIDLGYRVVIRGPFVIGVGIYEVRISW